MKPELQQVIEQYGWIENERFSSILNAITQPIHTVFLSPKNMNVILVILDTPVGASWIACNYINSSEEYLSKPYAERGLAVKHIGDMSAPMDQLPQFLKDYMYR